MSGLNSDNDTITSIYKLDYMSLDFFSFSFLICIYINEKTEFTITYQPTMIYNLVR